MLFGRIVNKNGEGVNYMEPITPHPQYCGECCHFDPETSFSDTNGQCNKLMFRVNARKKGCSFGKKIS